MYCLLSNPGLRGENPAADRPSRGIAPTWLAQRITLILTIVFVGNDHLAVGRSGLIRPAVFRDLTQFLDQCDS